MHEMQEWGHFATECLEEKDVHHNCGKYHLTKDCPDRSKHYCVSCDSRDHASWDRGGPKFRHRAEKKDENCLENVLTFFPTDEGWTHHIRLVKLNIDERFSAKYKVASLPTLKQGKRQMPTWQVKFRKKDPRGKQVGRAGPMDNFLELQKGKAQAPTNPVEEIDFCEAYFKDEIMKHLNTTFTAE
jgi:hypothetical protein